MPYPHTEWVSLGGNNEDDIGGNCHMVSYFDGKHTHSILIDAGNKFSKTPGYDQFFPMLPKGIKAIFNTHGHLDHIGAPAHYLNYGLSVPPSYGSPLTMNVQRVQLGRVYGNEKPWHQIHEIEPGRVINVGHFRIEGVSVSHSIPQAMGFYVVTPNARLFFTGDCKWDTNLPVKPTTDAQRLAQIGAKGLDALFLDSTRCHQPGMTRTEQDVREDIRADVLAHPEVTEFIMPIMSTSVQRFAILAQLSQEMNIPVVYEGRAIEDMLEAARRSGIKLKEMYPGSRIHHVRSFEGQQITQSCTRHFHPGTGSQGEINAFFAKALRGGNQNVMLHPEKTRVLFLASVIPGNENLCAPLFATLDDMGISHVIIHTSGHGSSGDLLKYSEVLAPRTLFPVHGSRDHIEHHAQIQTAAGHMVMKAMNGDVVRWVGKNATPVIVGHIETPALACKEVGQEWVTNARSKKESLRNLYEYAVVNSWDAPKPDSGIVLPKDKKIIAPRLTPGFDPE